MTDNLTDYCIKDALIAQEIYKELKVNWFVALWYRIRFGANWMMK